jgi:hypothetical protein
MKETQYKKRPDWIDWTVIFLLIANTANPFFFQSVEMLSISFIILIILFNFSRPQKVTYNKYLYLYIISILILQFCQTIVYHVFPIKTFLGEYLRIGFAILALSLLGQDFFERFVRFVYVFAVISLCFYFPSVLIKGFAPFMIQTFAKYTLAPFVNNFEGLYTSRENLIIFNFNQIGLYRNSGFYWEPGSHGGILVIAFFLNLFYRREAFLSRYNIIFLITILTTLSTTTYLALFFVILIYLKNFFQTRPLLSLFIFLLLITCSLLLYTRLEFLNNKIDKQIEYSNKGVPGESRFNSFLADMKIMSQHPFIGTGRSIEMKFGKNYFNIGARQIHRNNGLGVLLGTYGVIFFSLFLFLLWKTFFKILENRINAFMGVILIIIIGFSEDYFFKVFFIALVIFCGLNFVPVHIRKKSGKMKLGLKTAI